jgi:ketol-acid reductoisomerase
MNALNRDDAMPGKTVVFGFGAQGRAQALNLRDSNVPIGVCLRKESPRTEAVLREGIEFLPDPSAAAAVAEQAILLLPDSKQPAFYREHLHDHLPRGAALIFAHGFSIHYKRIKPRKDLDVLLAAPLAHGELLRNDFYEQRGVPCALAIHQDATGRARERLQHYARSIAGNGPFIWSSFQEEVEIDLFAEQAVLCGGMPELIKASFETLLKNGYNEEISYISCLREIRAIVNLMLDHSIAGMRQRISDTAQYGSLTRGPRLIGAAVRAELQTMLSEIRSGRFAEELSQDEQQGFVKLTIALREEASHDIEKAHLKYTALAKRASPAAKN